MLIYLFLLISSFVLSFLSVNYVKSKNYFNFLLILLFLTIVIIVGFRDDVGVDFLGYRENFNQIFFGGSSNYEWGFRYISELFFKLGFKDWSIFLFAALVTWFFILISFKIFPKILPWGLFYIFTGGWFFSSLNGIRQIMAVAIFVYAFKFIRERKLIKYTAYILFASLFHKSVILMIPLYFFIHKLNFKSSFWLFLYLISYPLSSYANLTGIVENLSVYVNQIFDFSIFQTDHIYNLDSLSKTYKGVYNSGLGLFYTYLFSGALIYFSQKLVKKRPEYTSYFNMYYIWAIIFMYTWQMSFFNRILMYFIVFGVFCFALVVQEYINDLKWKVFVHLLVFFQLIYFLLLIFNKTYSFI